MTFDDDYEEGEEGEEREEREEREEEEEENDDVSNQCKRQRWRGQGE